jgi:hypothetical protein
MRPGTVSEMESQLVTQQSIREDEATQKDKNHLERSRSTHCRRPIFENQKGGARQHIQSRLFRRGW